MNALAQAGAVLLLGSTLLAEPLPRSTPQQEGFDPARFQRVSSLVREAIDSHRLAGASVLVARHGRIVASESFGVRDVESGAPMEATTICRIYSMTKVITSVAVLQLFERNQLTLTSTVGDFARFEIGRAHV